MSDATLEELIQVDEDKYTIDIGVAENTPTIQTNITVFYRNFNGDT